MSSRKIFSCESHFSENLIIPTSKSYINRLLIFGSLVAEKFTIKHVTYSQDVRDLLNLLKLIGLEIEVQDDVVSILNSFPSCEKRSLEPVILRSGPGGTTNRFLIALLANGRNSYQLIPDERLINRPMAEMWNVLDSCNVTFSKISNGQWPIFQGPIELPNKLTIDTSKTTQVASAILMQTISIDCDITINNKKNSYNYYELTLHLLKCVQDGQRDFMAPYDFSSLSYLIAYGIVVRQIKISGVGSLDPLQADSKLFKILKDSGGNISLSCKGLEVIPSKLNAMDLDCSDFPDLVPTLCFIASYSQGISRLRNIKNLQLKESNRIDELLTILKLFSIESHYNSVLDSLEIVGSNKSAQFITYCSPNDHRMAMIAMLFMINNNGGEIENFECVGKSFPSLLDDNSFC